LQYGGHWGINVPFGGQVDFRLQSVSGNIGARVFGGWIYVGNVSEWSAVQTVTVPDFSLFASSSPKPTPSPTSTVPEFSWLAIIPLLISMLLIVGKIKHRKIANLNH
jgi:hypothetical protein